jgi:hypothetical protein
VCPNIWGGNLPLDAGLSPQLSNYVCDALRRKSLSMRIQLPLLYTKAKFRDMIFPLMDALLKRCTTIL